MSRTSRLFELINVLRARRTPVTAQYLARELGISQRSIYRDIETLRSLGAPLEGQAGVGYCLREGFFLPEFAFSSDELDALILGLGWVRQRADPALAQCSESALAKILSARKNGLVTGGEPPALVTAASASRRMDSPEVALLRMPSAGNEKSRSAMKTLKARYRIAPSGRSLSSISTMCVYWRRGANTDRPSATSASIVCT